LGVVCLSQPIPPPPPRHCHLGAMAGGRSGAIDGLLREAASLRAAMAAAQRTWYDGLPLHVQRSLFYGATPDVAEARELPLAARVAVAADWRAAAAAAAADGDYEGARQWAEQAASLFVYLCPLNSCDEHDWRRHGIRDASLQLVHAFAPLGAAYHEGGALGGQPGHGGKELNARAPASTAAEGATADAVRAAADVLRATYLLLATSSLALRQHEACVAACNDALALAGAVVDENGCALVAPLYWRARARHEAPASGLTELQLALADLTKAAEAAAGEEAAAGSATVPMAAAEDSCDDLEPSAAAIEALRLRVGMELAEGEAGMAMAVRRLDAQNKAAAKEAKAHKRIAAATQQAATVAVSGAPSLPAPTPACDAAAGAAALRPATASSRFPANAQRRQRADITAGQQVAADAAGAGVLQSLDFTRPTPALLAAARSAGLDLEDARVVRALQDIQQQEREASVAAAGSDISGGSDGDGEGESAAGSAALSRGSTGSKHRLARRRRRPAPIIGNAERTQRQGTASGGAAGGEGSAVPIAAALSNTATSAGGGVATLQTAEDAGASSDSSHDDGAARFDRNVTALLARTDAAPPSMLRDMLQHLHRTTSAGEAAALGLPSTAQAAVMTTAQLRAAVRGGVQAIATNEAAARARIDKRSHLARVLGYALLALVILWRLYQWGVAGMVMRWGRP
jgi:hypothetical protein